MLDMNTNMQTNSHEYKYKLIETKEKIESKPRETKKKLSSTKQLHQVPLHVLFSSRWSDRYRMGSSINWGCTNVDFSNSALMVRKLLQPEPPMMR